MIRTRSIFTSLCSVMVMSACDRPKESQTQASDLALTQEDTVFDQHMETPDDLIRKLYGQSRILILETSNHNTFKRYELVQNLLTNISAADSVLRYIVLERFQENDGFYKDLSIKPLAKLNLDDYFHSPLEKIQSLCGASEWSFSVDRFLPTIQTYNANRPMDKQVYVATVDGVSDKVPSAWPWAGDGLANYQLKSATCTFKAAPKEAFIPVYTVSGNREDDTEKNFEALYGKLKPGEKMIIVYHHAHAIDTLNSCMPFMLDGRNWESRTSRLGWISRFLALHPDARKDMKMVLLDEKDPEYNADGVLKFSARQAKRHPGASFAIDLSAMRGYLPEVGMNAFTDTAYLQTYQGGQHHSSETAPEFFDGIVWTDDAIKSYLLKDSHTYLPDICAVETDEDN